MKLELGSTGAALDVRAPETRGTLRILDSRAPTFTAAEVEEAAQKLAERSGPIVALVRTKTEQAWEAVLSECNQLAGGQASMRVMLLAHHALRAHQALELQCLAAGRAFQSYVDPTVGTDSSKNENQAEKHMRNQAGLAVVATDCLNKAYEAAREEGKARTGSPTEQLFARLGVSAAGDAADPVPADAPGVGSVGPPLSPNPAPEKDQP